jgi:hypothetical protein
MLVIRPEIVCDRPRLNDRIEVERGQRLASPSLPAEGHVGVERRDLFGPRRQMGNRDVEKVLLGPSHGRGAEWDMRKSRTGEVGEIVAPRTVGAFRERDGDVRLFEPIRDCGARERNAAFPAQRIRHAADDMKRFHETPDPRIKSGG